MNLTIPTSKGNFAQSVVSHEFNGVVDDVFIMGAYNLKTGTHGTKEDPDEPLLKHQFEAHYFNGTEHLMEWNLDYIPADNVSPMQRFLAFAVDRITNASRWLFTADWISLANPGTTGIVLKDGNMGFGKAPVHAGVDVAGNVNTDGGTYKSSAMVTIAALNEWVNLPAPADACGKMLFRDQTSGGSAEFIVEAGGFAQQLNGITGLEMSSPGGGTVPRIRLTSGAVPRVLRFGAFLI